MRGVRDDVREDLLVHEPTGPPWLTRLPRWRRIVVMVAAAVVFVAVVAAIRQRPVARPAPRPSPTAAFNLDPARTVALALGPSTPGSTVERRDPTAANGPW